MRNAIRKDLTELNVPFNALSELSRLLDRTDTGSTEVYLSPMGKSKDPEAILKGWDSIFNSNRGKLNDVLLALEENNRSKYGPRSIAVPWSERRDTVLNSFSPDNGKEVESNIVSNGRFRPISLANAAKYIKLQTNAGLPFMSSKGKVLSETLGDIDRQLDENYPSVPFTRTQENEKTRLVWGYPLATVLDEMRFYRPILEFQRNVPWRAALKNADDIDAAITQLINHARSDGKSLVSIDFSNFDNSVKRSLQNYAFKVYFPSLFQRQYHP